MNPPTVVLTQEQFDALDDVWPADVKPGMVWRARYGATWYRVTAHAGGAPGGVEHPDEEESVHTSSEVIEVRDA